MKVVIVGGVAGGASAAARLRRLNEEAEIVLYERGEYISYANCGLPYFIGGEITDRAELTLQTPESFRARFRVDVRTCHEVVKIYPDQKEVTVRDLKSGQEYRESYQKLLLSPGAAPVRPPIPGVEDPRVFTLRTVPDTLAIKQYIERVRPANALVIGGGYIGVEMAENLARSGIAVTVVEQAGHLIGSLDEEMACEVQAYLRRMGVCLRLSDGVKAICPKGESLLVELEQGAVETQLVILSIGVSPESALGREAGLALGERGAIAINEYLQTSQPDIYAVGDVIQVTHLVSGKPVYLPLAGPANKQGRIAAGNMCGEEKPYRGSQGSTVLKVFDMTVACTGLSEQAACRAGFCCDKAYLLSSSHASYYPGAASLSIKVVFEVPTGRVLGAQIIGYKGVEKRCDVLATAIRAGMTAGDLAELELCYAPPYSSAKDPVNMAGFVIENILEGKISQYHWHEVDALPRDGSITLLDVRTPGEYARGCIAGSVNIPLDSLRQHLDEIPPGKPVYVNCQSGLRSYLACRILAQKGFVCHNLGGGYRLYRLAKEEQAAYGPIHPCGAGKDMD